MAGMERLIARVRNGRLVLDAPTDLPEGMDVPLELSDDLDDMTDAERAVLREVLKRSFAEVAAGRTRPAQDVLRELDAGA